MKRLRQKKMTHDIKYSQLEENINQAMQYALSLGIDYADIRFKDIATETLTVINGELTTSLNNRSRGYGIRVYKDGVMGFAANSDLNNLHETVNEAVKIAKASLTSQTNKVYMTAKKTVIDFYTTPYDIDPFTVPLTKKIALLMECDCIMHSTQGVSHRFSSMQFRKEIVFFADTDGSFIEQRFYQSAAWLKVFAASKMGNQKRSYNSVLQAGYESILTSKLPIEALRIAKEVVELSKAPVCPSGVFDIILAPSQLFMQIHESIGHPTEIDQILINDPTYVNQSFLDLNDLDRGLIIGSEHVTIVADATCPTGLGTFAYDDEGTPGQCITLINKGVFTGFQTTRDTAHAINQTSSGTGRSDSWHNIPIARMTNINLLPGNETLDDLLSGIEYGFLLDENRKFDIDDSRINFKFTCEIAYEIKNGKLTGHIYKNPTYSGKTIDLWKSCDGVADLEHWKIIGAINCGKGSPMQLMRISHGSSPARFRNVRIGD